MNLLRRHKHAILLAALIFVALVESVSHWQVLGPVLSDLAIVTMLLLVSLIVFVRWVNRLVAFIACGTVVVVDWAHYLLPSYPEATLQLIYHSTVLLMVGFATLVILGNIFEQHVVRVDDVLGAMCGYLLAAIAWSRHIYAEMPPARLRITGFMERMAMWKGAVIQGCRYLGKVQNRWLSTCGGECVVASPLT